VKPRHAWFPFAPNRKHRRLAVPLFADLIAALLAGLVAFVVARWYAGSPSTPDRPAQEVARAAGDAIEPHRGLRRLLAGRLDRSTASGLLLSLALLITLAGWLILGVLALLVRRVAALQHVDNSIAAWGYDHKSASSTSGLQAITNLGNIKIVVVLAALLAVAEVVRGRNRWAPLFLLVVLAGMEGAMIAVKDLVDRVRPALVPAAAHLGPSFPSGHSATAASFYAAAALVIGRHLRPSARHVVIALAVAVAVAVAGSRVLLDLHWLSDVVGGLSLGWAWFAVCAVAFGGRLLRPTAGVEAAAAEATSRGRSTRTA
jgi:membrane-associated phospholipid phosphatase